MQEAMDMQLVIGNLFCNCVRGVLKRKAMIVTCFINTTSKSK